MTRPSGMATQPSYLYDESIHLHPNLRNDIGRLDIGVTIIANATLTLPLSWRPVASTSATPFPMSYQDLLLHYGLKSILVQSSSSSVSSFSPKWPRMTPDHVAGTPIGTSIRAELITAPCLSTSSGSSRHHANSMRWEDILRQLSGSNLGCGSLPLASMETKYNQHQLYHNPINTLLGNGTFDKKDRLCAASSSAVDGEEEEVAVFHANLPTSEGIGMMMCSDGIQSFRSLLPCRDRGGLLGMAAMEKFLHGAGGEHDRIMWIQAKSSGKCHVVNDTNSHIMNTEQNHEHSGQEPLCRLELRQGVSYTVKKRLDTRNDHVDFTLADLLGTTAYSEGEDFNICPLSSSTKIYTNIDKDLIPYFHFDSHPDEVNNGGIQMMHNLGIDRGITKSQMTISTRTLGSSIALSTNELEKETFRIHRRLIKIGGSSQFGGIGAFRTIIINNLDCSVDISTIDLFPKVVKPILHSLEVSVGRHDGNYEFRLLDITTLRGYRLTLDDDGSATLELKTQIPRHSVFAIQMEYDHRFLPFEDLPADPNRGIDIPPSIVTFSTRSIGGCAHLSSSLNTTSLLTTRTLHSNPIIVMIPLPDTTMPFNVISLTCTIYAFIIGSMINILVRRSSTSIKKLLESDENQKKESLKTKIMTKGKKIINNFRTYRKTKKD